MIPDEVMMRENGITSMDFHSMLGRTELVIKLENTMAIGVRTKSSFFLDHSIVLWSEGALPGQWHFNYYSGIALASTPTLAGALYKWMMNNGLASIVSEFFNEEFELRFQSIDTGSEGNSSYAYCLMDAHPTQWSKEGEFTVNADNKRMKTSPSIAIREHGHHPVL
eukprot:3349094-Amphidinium_carterae.2